MEQRNEFFARMCEDLLSRRTCRRHLGEAVDDPEIRHRLSGDHPNKDPTSVSFGALAMIATLPARVA